MASKISAMQRIATDTDRYGGSMFPNFMLENMRGWEREGLISLTHTSDGPWLAIIAEAGRKLAKKGNVRA